MTSLLAENTHAVTTMQREFSLLDASGKAVRFTGELLASDSTREDFGARSQRWTEIEIYRRSRGGYVTHVIGRSVVPGEVDFHTTKLAAEPEDVYASVVHGEKPIWIEHHVLVEAAKREELLSAWLGDRLEVEVLESGIGWGQRHVIPRDGDRALRFYGLAIGNGLSQGATDGNSTQYAWTGVTIYAVSQTRAIPYYRYVIHKTRQRSDASLPPKSSVWIVRTGKEAVSVLAGQRKPGEVLEPAAFDALDRSADCFEDFESTLDGVLENGRYLSRDRLATAPAGPSARQRVLEIFASGAILITRPIDYRKSRVVGWLATDAPVPSPRVFSWLAGQQLIRRCRSTQAVAGGLARWEISDTGLEALRQIQAVQP